MQDIIAVKIDVTKIEKQRLFDGKNGAKWLDILLIPTPDNKFGNSHMAVQAVSKEERLAGTRGPILGNAKVYAPRGKTEPKTPAPSAQTRTAQQENEDSIPF